MWHVLFALIPFLVILTNFRFLFFSGLSQTFRDSTPGLSESEKISWIWRKKSSDYHQRNRFKLKNKKKTLFHYTYIYIYIHTYIYIDIDIDIYTYRYIDNI